MKKALLLLATLLIIVAPAQAHITLYDDLQGTTLDTNLWLVSDLYTYPSYNNLSVYTTSAGNKGAGVAVKTNISYSDTSMTIKVEHYIKNGGAADQHANIALCDGGVDINSRASGLFAVENTACSRGGYVIKRSRSDNGFWIYRIGKNGSTNYTGATNANPTRDVWYNVTVKLTANDTGNRINVSFEGLGVNGTAYFNDMADNRPDVNSTNWTGVLQTFDTGTGGTGYFIVKNFYYNQPASRINVTYRDEYDKRIIDFETVSVDFISDDYSDSDTTTVGNTLTLLTYPASYSIRYSSPSYEERFYYLTVNDNLEETLNLYLINKSLASNVTINIIDENANDLEGAVVKSQKYDPSTNTYLLQEASVTDSEGDTHQQLLHNEEYYKFTIQYNGRTLKTTTPAYITTNLITIQVTVGEAVGSEYYDRESISKTLVYNNDTNNFRFTFNDPSGVSSEFCLTTYRMQTTSKTVYNKTCLTSGTGTILHPIQRVNGSSWASTATYKDDDGVVQYLIQAVKSFPDNTNFGDAGLFFQILLTLTVAFIAIYSIPASAILVPISLLVGRAIGLIGIGYEYLIPLTVVGVIIALSTGRRS